MSQLNNVKYFVSHIISGNLDSVLIHLPSVLQAAHGEQIRFLSLFEMEHVKIS